MVGPAQYFFRLSLGCLGENSITRRVDADGEVLECAWPVNGSFVSLGGPVVPFTLFFWFWVPLYLRPP